MNSKAIILASCLKEIKKFPESLQKDVLVLIMQLNQGVKFSFPLSRPMSDIGNGVHELRLKEKSG